MAQRTDLRNIAIVAHVDHGKTTLVDAMLWQTGAFRDNQDVATRVMDSMDLEREKGITILAKNTAIAYNDVTINVIDTPGHADFGGEVERGLFMVDGVVLLVDACEGPLPQTRFVVDKTLARGLPVILVINKIDRPDARIAEVVDEVYELFIDLGADAEQIDFPIVYCNAKRGTATRDPEAEGADLTDLFTTLVEHVPAPEHDPDHPFQALVTNLDASPYLGRLALCRVRHGTVRRGQTIAWCRTVDESITRAKVAELYITRALDRVEAEHAGPGDIIAVAGLPEVTIGDTLADPDDPRPVNELHVEEPSMSVVIGINTSPLAGQDGTRLTARLLRQRLEQELVGNVSIRVLDTDRPDAWEVQGRGELQLAVLVEMMRREGFELTVGRPQVVTREVDGQIMEPVEHLVVDVPDEHMGSVTQLLAARRGTLQGVTNVSDSWVRMTFTIPTRGLIGIRTHMLTETRGTAVMHQIFDSWQPWHGPLPGRGTGSLVADRTGAATMHALMSLQERGSLFIAPGDQVYEGAVIGVNPRAEDLDVNPTREKKLTNMRSSTADELVRLNARTTLTLDEALEMVRDDECVEVTPSTVRVRKVELSATQRAKTARSQRPPRGD